MTQTKQGVQPIIVKDSHRYFLPKYEMGDVGLETFSYIEINLVKGSKLGEGVEKQEGVIIEQLLELCKSYLISVNKGSLANKFSTRSIKYINKALSSLKSRAKDRQKRLVQNTYKS